MDTPAPHWLAVAVALPAHGTVSGPLTYASEQALAPGTLVRVPLGRREVLGVVWGTAPAPRPEARASIKTVVGALPGLPVLTPHWLQLVGFAARYYQRAVGEVALAALPPQLRTLDAVQLARRLQRQAARASANPPEPAAQGRNTADAAGAGAPLAAVPPPLTADQQAALEVLHGAGASQPFVLFGATGSGKTEVYLQRVATVLAQDPQAQALVMVPEINLTPQLEARFAARLGAEASVSLHSGMTDAQRLKSWLAAHSGAARIVLGTRMAVFASLPRLRLIVVDEEHDASYKQQEGARYSARDLAIYRGKLEGAQVILGSATPSLETWQASQPAAAAHTDQPPAAAPSVAAAGGAGRYRRLVMPWRVGAAPGPADAPPLPAPNGFPQVRRVDMNQQPRGTVLAPPLLAAIRERIACGQQALVLLNRRGWAPVLHCAGCGWKSQCPHCSAWRVFHKIDRTLRCHHCGLVQRVPRACPDCGDLDIAPLGRGTEQLEQQLAALLADALRPDGKPAVVARIDADTTRRKGALAEQLAQVHAGAVDVLVGTQMLAKGHDFRRITLVAAVNPDGALFSSDFRAPERLFALLLQAAGRAGRDAAQGQASQMWVQTHHPAHPLFEALKHHDYPAFAQRELAQRRQAGLPPFSFQALVRADARTQALAQGFLNAAQAALQAALSGDEPSLLAHVNCYPAVPLAVQRVANVERAQLLVESASRAALQRLLAHWQPVLRATRARPEFKAVLRWSIDVDPLAI